LKYINKYFSECINEKNNEEEMKLLIKDLYRVKNDLYTNFLKIVNLEEPFYSLIALIELYLFWKVSKVMNDKIIILIIGNVIIFYSMIEKKYPKFLFRCRMFVKEIIEGVLSAIMALFPKYEEQKEK
jgi:hypothetical protein